MLRLVLIIIAFFGWLNIYAQLSINFSQNDVLCNGNCTGTATVIPSGGISPYNAYWDFGPTTFTVNNLCAGTYGVWVVDAIMDSVYSLVTIMQPSPITNTFSSIYGAVCYGDCNATACANPSGGSPGYYYLWVPNYSTSQCPTNLCPPSQCTNGYQMVYITDNLGCTFKDSLLIPEPFPITISINSTSDNGLCNGTATVVASGGSGSFSYMWDAGTGNQITSTAVGLCAGNYCVTVTDSLGCTNDTCVVVNMSTGINMQVKEEKLLYPNPVNTLLRIDKELLDKELIITDVTGKKIKKVLPITGLVNVEELPSGIYFIRPEKEMVIIRKFIKQ